MARLEIFMTMHAENRARLVEALRKTAANDAVVLLQGGATAYRHDTDHEELFRQESNFHWAFGVEEADCYGAIDVASGLSTLFIPRLGIEYAVWMGKIPTPEEVKARYQVDDVRYTDELATVLPKSATLLVMHGVNTDSGATSPPVFFSGIDDYTVERATLHPVLTELRVFKTEAEVRVLRYAAEVSVAGHIEVMKAVRPGMHEYQLESLFLHHCYSQGGCRHCGYTCICAAGCNSAVLHYGHAGAPNRKQIVDGDMCLFDMGAEYHCYGADITCSFPANGKFTDRQRWVYNAVLAANRAVIAAIRPGVLWTDMHLLAERVILTALVHNGLLVGAIDDLERARVAALFMPHGLGHFLGIDTHDVGGYPSGVERPTAPGIKRLRTARVLAANMYITVEPGLYFIDALLTPALANPDLSKYLVADRIKEYLSFGGVRIEDDVLVTATGAELLSKVPRTVEEIEAIMQSARSA